MTIKKMWQGRASALLFGLITVGMVGCHFNSTVSSKSSDVRVRESFNDNWRFRLSKDSAIAIHYQDSDWRVLDLPHDWSIEGEFSEKHPAGVGGGALPGGTGWYRKTFQAEEAWRAKKVYITFDGVYRDSEVWINETYLGKRPNGYISFSYDLTPNLRFGENNVVVVKVDNSRQPNSRWYSGSGIYRNVWLSVTSPVHVDEWGTFVTTPRVTRDAAEMVAETSIKNASGSGVHIKLETIVMDPDGSAAAIETSELDVAAGTTQQVSQRLNIKDPQLWSVTNPELYTVLSRVYQENQLVDEYKTSTGIRYFDFHPESGFSLNGEPMKVLGVCNHHDLGALGAAINTRAMERQLEILKEMGVNGIRTSHNPPAPELLDLCDKMGFIVMDEMFDMWKKKKSEFDYSQYWDEWHVRDLEDFIRRDRNHPSVMIWSIGNEIGEQWDSTGVTIAKELAGIVRELDPTRPITTGNNEVQPYNNIIKSGALDIIGYNYNHKDYADFHKRYPRKKFIATETTSALATRGHYDMPSDSIRRWPISWDKLFTEGNKDNTVSAYDNVSAPWGSTHEETWKVMKKHPHLSGMFIWTGFDYLGEPTPYVWPSRSSYFGVVDLAGFPKDSYYMYQSEWTNKDVLHVFPHWNWSPGQLVDVWAYYNRADEVELFLNGKSQGIRRKQGDDLHVMWRLPFEPGTVKVVARKNGSETIAREVKTAGRPTRIVLKADREKISADGKDLSFITATIVDDAGVTVPYASNAVTFMVEGNAVVVATDNGDPTNHESFQSKTREAFNGYALAIVQSGKAKGTAKISAASPGLENAQVTIEIN